MNLKHSFLVLLSLLSSSAHCAQPQLPLEEPSFLEQAISESTKTGDAPWLEQLLEYRHATPLFYDAAKHAHAGVAAVVCRHAHEYEFSRESRQEILERLIISGHAPNVHAFFEAGIVKPEDIHQGKIGLAKYRARLHNPNKSILKFLQQKRALQYPHNRRRKKRANARKVDVRPKAQKRRFKAKRKPPEIEAIQLDSCSICLEDIEPQAFKGKDPKAWKLDCTHTFDKECITTWMHKQLEPSSEDEGEEGLPANPTCPMCRTDIVTF
jgi:hypothetical protein